MGCDIHMYVEYSREVNSNEEIIWLSFGGRFDPGRHYGLFAKLAGVRNYGSTIIPISAPRGLPDNIGWSAREDNCLDVCDDSEDLDEYGRSCTRESADRWVASGRSIYIGERRNSVTNPDYHSHSWVNREELEAALNDPEAYDRIESDSPDWECMLDILKSFERQGCSTRIVFWFDN